MGPLNVMLEMTPWLMAMAVLIGCSAFFSGSEAALFYLRWDDRRALAAGGPAQRTAVDLLYDPNRLLSAVLLWNLAINMTYFGIAAIIGLRFEREAGHTPAFVFSATSLLAIIFFSEMLPKSLAVLGARQVAGWVGLPLATAVRLVDPLMPALRLVCLLSRRVIWPGFRREPYLEVSDLERAIELSTSDANLVKQEQATLRNIVMLSDMRAEEWMRPRTQFVTFTPPVSLADLEGKMTPSGYLLLTEPDSEEVVGAVNLTRLITVPDDGLERFAQDVLYLPWCATVADVLQQIQRAQREVVAVVNELGETIGIITILDLMDTLFLPDPSRSDRLLERKPILQVSASCWHVNGMTSLRRLGRAFDVSLPASRHVTVAGVIQELLQRLPERADEVDWGPFHFRVLEAPQRGHMVVELTRRHEEAAEP